MKNENMPNVGNARYGFETFFKEDGKYYFQFNDLDGEPILFSRGYPTESERTYDIQVIINHAGNADRYDFRKSKSGKHLFAMKTADQKEIGRSRLFITRKEMEKKMALLKSLEADVPVLESARASGSEEMDLSEKNLKQPVADEPHQNQAPVAAEKPGIPEQANLMDDPEIMTRYKFSVIYYPNSSIWAIKNDFSGESKQLKACDGQQIEAFLKAQIPAGELKEVTDISVKDDIKDEPAPSSMEGKMTPVAAARTPENPVPFRVNLSIRTAQGEIIQKSAARNQLQQIEAAPQSAKNFQSHLFEARATARRLEDNQTVVIGTVNNQIPTADRFIIPVYGLQNLKPGTYLFTTKIYQKKETQQPVEFYGSQLVVLQ